jgi:MoxR-like ATPase
VNRSSENAGIDISRVKEAADRLIDNVGRVIVGRREPVELILVALLGGGHVLIEDVPGIGKTMLARAVARSLGYSFKRIQATPDLLPSDVTGVNYFNQKTADFEFRPGPVFANIVLIDEMEGTFPLPEAQLDRFLLKVRLGYPDSGDEEGAILARFERSDPLESLESVVGAAELLEMQEICRQVFVDESVRDYVTAVTRATRSHEGVKLGASPRASLGLHRASQALAALRGRGYVIPDDVKFLAAPVLAHRLVCKTEARLRGRTHEAIVGEVLSTVPVPVEG